MVVDLSKVKTTEELSAAIGGNMTVPKAEEQATPLESWKEQEYIALHNQIIAHGRNACESILYMAQDLKRMNTEKLNKLREKQKAGIGMQSLLRLRKLIGEGIAVTPETLAMCQNYRFNELCLRYDGKALRDVVRYLRKQDIKASEVVADYLAQCRGYHNYTSMEDDPQVERFCGQWLDYIGQKETLRVRAAA